MLNITNGDCIEVMAGMDADSVSAIVTDPPYGLAFMGKAWDRYSAKEFQEWCEAWGREALRVLKPGGHLAAFGGTRTYHRMTAGLEDAGFEIRDCLAWMYGSGFPKSHNLSKAIDKAAGAEREVVGANPNHRGVSGVSYSAVYSGSNTGARHLTAPATPEADQWDGWGTALKPAHEPIALARKPLAGTVAANVLEHGTGALNIDGCRVGMSDEDREKIEKATRVGRSLERKAYGHYSTDGTDSGMSAHSEGRWPANVILDEQAGAMLDAQAPRSGNHGGAGEYPSRSTFGGGVVTSAPPDTGGASRFFYCPKTSKKERAGATHPTVKPLALMQWLCRLVTPPGGLILDPFTGSGSTLIAAHREGFKAVGIERESEYVEMAQERFTNLGELC